MRSLLADFRDFILRGNVVDLAVAVVIGAAFTGVVNALVKDLLTPLLAAIGGQPELSAVTLTVQNNPLLIGRFIIAAVIFFLVVRPLNALMARFKTEPPVSPATRECPYCLSSIPIRATRCAF